MMTMHVQSINTRKWYRILLHKNIQGRSSVDHSHNNVIINNRASIGAPIGMPFETVQRQRECSRYNENYRANMKDLGFCVYKTAIRH